MRGNTDESSTTSECCFATKAHGTGHSRPTAYDQDMAEITFVRISFPWSLQGSELSVAYPSQNGRLLRTTLGRDVEAGKTQITDAGRAFIQKQATFQTDKSDRQVCLHGDTHHTACVGIQSGRYIERQDRRYMPLDGIDDLGVTAFKVTFQAATQQCINQQLSLSIERSFRGRGRNTLGGESLEGGCRITLQGIRR